MGAKALVIDCTEVVVWVLFVQSHGAHLVRRVAVRAADSSVPRRRVVSEQFLLLVLSCLRARGCTRAPDSVLDVHEGSRPADREDAADQREDDGRHDRHQRHRSEQFTVQLSSESLIYFPNLQILFEFNRSNTNIFLFIQSYLKSYCLNIKFI